MAVLCFVMVGWPGRGEGQHFELGAPRPLKGGTCSRLSHSLAERGREREGERG